MTHLEQISINAIIEGDHKVLNIPSLIVYKSAQDFHFKHFEELKLIDFIHEDVVQNECRLRIERLMDQFRLRQKQKRQYSELDELTRFVRHQKQSLDETLKLQLELGQVKESAYEKEVAESKRKMVSAEVESSKVQSGLKALAIELKSLQKNVISGALQNESICSKLKELHRRVNSFISEKDNKTDFLKVFEKIEPTFFKKLINTNARLTPLDLKHCAYIRLNVDNYELANIFNVEMKSLQMSRYRLKKKLNLEKDQTLREYILAL